MRANSKKLIRIMALATAAIILAFAIAGTAHASAGGSGSPADWNWVDIGYGDKDIAGGTLEKGEPKMPPPTIFAIINFCLFAGLLVWKAAPPIKKFVQQRHITIKEALEESARLREEAKQKLDEYSEKIANVNAEVDELLAGIRADAEAERERIIAEAEAQAEALKRDAEARIAADLARARRELELEIIAAATAAAERLIREKATLSDQHKLIDTFISGIAPSSSPSPTAPQERS